MIPLKHLLRSFVFATGLVALGPVHAQLESEIVTRFSGLGKGLDPLTVRFSPTDARFALARDGKKNVIVDLKEELMLEPGRGEMLQWVGDRILVAKEGRYSLLEPGGSDAVAIESAQPSIHAKPYALQGRGKSARVVDTATGKTIYKPGFGKGIYGLEISGNAERLLVYRGDADYVAIDRETKKKIPLPSGPDPENKEWLFSSWKWDADGQHVIGTVAFPVPGPEGREGGLSGKTDIYLYHLETKRLQKINLPSELRNKNVEVLDAGLDGKLFVRVWVESPEYRSEGAWVLRILPHRPETAAVPGP
ncbi:MAG: hypothetical protein AAF514_16075 [Verrucomicrobiota bacterium]